MKITTALLTVLKAECFKKTLGRTVMVRAVYRLDDKGKRVYLGHVPDEYELRAGEHFYPLNDDGGKD